MGQIRAWAAAAAGKPLELLHHDPGPLTAQEVEIAVEHCGICHSDLSALDNDWGSSRYPLIAGHEVIGRVVATGEQTQGLSIGMRVGVGWNASTMPWSTCAVAKCGIVWCLMRSPTALLRPPHLDARGTS